MFQKNTAQGTTALGPQAAQQDNPAPRPRTDRAQQPATASDEARRDPSTATKQSTQHRTKRRTTAQQSTKRNSAPETSTRTQRDRATLNSKTHHGRAPHRQKQPGAPRKGKEKRKEQNQQRKRQHTAAEHNKNSATRPSTTPCRTAQRRNPAQHKHATQHHAKHKAHHRSQHNTTRRRTTHNTRHNNQPGGQHNQHTPDEKMNSAQHTGGGGGNTTRHPATGQNVTPKRRKQHTPTQGETARRKPGATGQPQHSTQGQRRAASAAEQDQRTKHTSWTQEATRGRATPPARRHQARATRKATTHREQAQPGSTERHSAIESRSQQHRRTHPTVQNTQTTPAPHNRNTTAGKKQKGSRQKKTNKNRNQGGKKKQREVGGERKKKSGGQAQDAKAQGTPGWNRRDARDNRGAQKEKKKKKHSNNHKQGNPRPEGPSKQRALRDRPQEKVRRTRTDPRGRPARLAQQGHAQAHTRGTRAWCPPTQKGRCRCPHKTAPVHRQSPSLKDGRYGKPNASVTGSTHANNRSARSPTQMLEGPARDNPSRGPERVRRGASPALLPRQRPAAGTKCPVVIQPPGAPRSRPVNPGAQG